MAPVLAFWAAAMVVGACALPVAFVLFRRFPDAGAGLAFPLGLVLSGYAYFVLRIGSVLPQGRGGAVLAVVALVVAAAAVAGQDRCFRETARRFAPGALAAAGLFTLCFFAYVSYRSYVPDIAGTEQPMDFMYLNAAIESGVSTALVVVAMVAGLSGARMLTDPEWTFTRSTHTPATD